MLQPAYEQLLVLARRNCRGGEPDELLHEALIEALRAGRADFTDPANRRWLAGVIRNKSKMAARSGRRRLHRDTAWHDLRPEPGPAPEPAAVAELLTGLPPALKAVAALALSGHSRREIGHLLRLDDAALRQRIAQLKRRLTTAGLMQPGGTPGLGLDLAYGAIRDALLPLLLRQGGVLATHDPDGHLFVVRRSQNA